MAAVNPGLCRDDGRVAIARTAPGAKIKCASFIF